MRGSEFFGTSRVLLHSFCMGLYTKKDARREISGASTKELKERNLYMKNKQALFGETQRKTSQIIT